MWNTSELQGCVSPDLRIEDKSATGVIADRSTDVKIEAIAGTIDEIGIVGGAEKNNAPRLQVRGERGLRRCNRMNMSCCLRWRAR